MATFLNEDEEEEKAKEEFLAQDKDATGEIKGEFEAGDYGQLLINIDNKFMLFDSTCEFINKLDFYDETKQQRQPKHL